MKVNYDIIKWRLAPEAIHFQKTDCKSSLDQKLLEFCFPFTNILLIICDFFGYYLFFGTMASDIKTIHNGMNMGCARWYVIYTRRCRIS